MKNIREIKNIIKTICSKVDAVMVDHDLNVSVLDKNLGDDLRRLVKNMTFNELNRVAGYFIEELEGDGVEMNDSDMDDPDTYLSFCINECGISRKDLMEYVYTFKNNNS